MLILICINVCGDGVNRENAGESALAVGADGNVYVAPLD